MRKFLVIALALGLTACKGPLLISPENLPEGASYLGCGKVALNGTFYAGDGFRCTKVGTGFDDVKKITTPAGTVEFE
jgi:hypothetical protein